VCDPNDLGEALGGVRLTTDRGGISLEDSDTTDCDVVLVADAAMARVTRSRVSNALGGGHLTLVGTQGVLEVTRTVVDVLDLKGDAGSIRVDNVTVSEALKAATGAGAVSLSALRMSARGVVQVETDSGDIIVSATNFAGIASIVTSGTITCVGNGFDDANPCTVTTSGDGGLTVVEQVDINCRTRGDCAYLGQVTITSARGNVLLRMDRWVRP
jgi:hypothetical protein